MQVNVTMSAALAALVAADAAAEIHARRETGLALTSSCIALAADAAMNGNGKAADALIKAALEGATDGKEGMSDKSVGNYRRAAKAGIKALRMATGIGAPPVVATAAHNTFWATFRGLNSAEGKRDHIKAFLVKDCGIETQNTLLAFWGIVSKAEENRVALSLADAAAKARAVVNKGKKEARDEVAAKEAREDAIASQSDAEILALVSGWDDAAFLAFADKVAAQAKRRKAAVAKAAKEAAKQAA